MTPCDWWPFLRGRTLWLVGDSITQVGSLQRTLEPCARAALLPACTLMQMQLPLGVLFCPLDCLRPRSQQVEVISLAVGGCIGSLQLLLKLAEYGLSAQIQYCCNCQLTGTHLHSVLT